MKKTYLKVQKCGALLAAGALLAMPLRCDLGEFESTSTVTLDGREVIQFLVRSAILTPIQDAIDIGVDRLFDRIEGDDEDA